MENYGNRKTLWLNALKKIIVNKTLLMLIYQMRKREEINTVIKE